MNRPQVYKGLNFLSDGWVDGWMGWKLMQPTLFLNLEISEDLENYGGPQW
jgi:hypothetical protein